MHICRHALLSTLDQTVQPTHKLVSQGTFIVFCLLITLASPARGQAEFPGAPDEASINLRVYPLDIWSPRAGLGIGGGLVFHHLGRSNAQGLLTFAPAHHEQVATFAWASANPQRAREYVVLNTKGVHTNRDWFYGLGPLSNDETRQAVERSSLDFIIRAGRTFFDRRLLVQPQVALTHHRIDRIPAPSDPGLSPSSRDHLLQLSSEDVGPLDPVQTGLRVGVAVEYDTKVPSSDVGPRLLIRTRWSRYVDAFSSFVQFDRVEVGAYATFHLGTRHRLTGRFSLSLTRSHGKAAVPYYMRPTLEGALVPGWSRLRFVASDRLVNSVVYRFPLAQLFKVVNLDGHLGVHAANVYDDFGSDRAVDVSFSEELDPSDGSIPLRPSASVGLHLGLSFRHVPTLDVAVGVSPEGASLARFTLNQSLNGLRRSPHHSIRDR